MSYRPATNTAKNETFDKAIGEDYIQLVLRMSGSALALYDIDQNTILHSSIMLEHVLGIRELSAAWQHQLNSLLDPASRASLLLLIADELPQYLNEPQKPTALEACHLIYPISYKDDHTRWIQHRVIPYSWTEDGYLTQCLFHFEDITPLPMPKHACAYRAPLYGSQRVATAFGEPQRLIDHLGISARELQVLRLIAMGHSRTTVGHMLQISPHTVDRHRKKLLEKTGTRTIAELVTYANKIKLT